MLESIIIIEHSEIIKQGLISIIQKYNLAKKICTFDSFDNMHNYSCDSNIIIINPIYLKDNIKKTRKLYNISEKCHFIAVVYNYLNKDIINPFDDIIYVDDSPQTISKKIEACKHEDDNHQEHTLSKREIEILKELIKGKTNKEVALEINLSVHTIVTHRKNIMEKTGIKSLSGLAVYAIVNNIVDIQEIQ